MNKQISSNEEIIPRIAEWKISNALDEPKKVALLALILDRLGKLEDEADTQKSLSDIVDETQQQPTNSLIDTGSDVTPPVAEPVTPVVEPTPETSVETVPTTSPDSPTQPEVTPPVQTAVETPPTETTQPVVDDESVDDGTISELTPEAIANGTDAVPSDIPTPDSTTP